MGCSSRGNPGASSPGSNSVPQIGHPTRHCRQRGPAAHSQCLAKQTRRLDGGSWLPWPGDLVRLILERTDGASCTRTRGLAPAETLTLRDSFARQRIGVAARQTWERSKGGAYGTDVGCCQRPDGSRFVRYAGREVRGIGQQRPVGEAGHTPGPRGIAREAWVGSQPGDLGWLRRASVACDGLSSVCGRRSG